MSLREPNMMERKKEKKKKKLILTKQNIEFYYIFKKERNRTKIILVRKYDRNLKLFFKKWFNKLGNQKIERKRKERVVDINN